MKTDSVDLPAAWAPGLINKDFTGYKESERKEIEQWVMDNPQFGDALGCSDHPSVQKIDGLLTECLTFTFPMRPARRSSADDLVHSGCATDAVFPLRDAEQDSVQFKPQSSDASLH